MDKKTLAKQLDGIKHPVHANLSQSIIESAAAHGLVIVYGASDDELEGAIHDEFGCFGGGIALVDKQGLLSRLDAEFDEEPESEEISLRKKAAREIEPRWCKEPGIRWTYRTTIPHATFHVMRDGEVECRGIVFALSELDGVAAPTGAEPETPAAPRSTGTPTTESSVELGEWKVDSSTLYRLMPAGYRRGEMTFKNAVTATVYADHASGISSAETAKRIAVCLTACEGIATERLEGKSLATLRNEPLMQRNQAIAAAEFFKGLIENLTQAERERVGLYSVPGWNEHERILRDAKEPSA